MAMNTLSDLEDLLVRMGLDADDREEVMDLCRNLDLSVSRGSIADEASLDTNPVQHLAQKAIRLGGSLDRYTGVEKAVLWGATKAWLSDGLKD